jgi:heat shock protein HtpX
VLIGLTQAVTIRLVEGAAATDVRIEPCPSCGTDMANDRRYARWCEACGWNLRVEDRSAPPGPIDRLYRRLGRRYGEQLAKEVAARGLRRPVLSLSTVVAGAIAALVYLLVLGLAVFGVVLYQASGGFIVGILVAALPLLLAWVMRPRLPDLDKDDEPLGRDQLPALFRAVDRVAEALGTAPADAIVVTPAVNAGFGRFGWRRRRILLLGLPLFSALTAQERVGLLAHELGHGRNGDPGRLLFLRGAVVALVEAWEVLEPDTILPGPEEGLVGYGIIPFRLVQLAIARSLLAVAEALLILSYRDGQRAEYHADGLAIRLAGTRAWLGVLERLHAAESAGRMSWTGEGDDPVGAIASRLRGLPAREIERIRRVERLDGPRLDVTHPPTYLREQVAAAVPRELGTLVLGAGESDAIDRELERFREPIGRRIRDEYVSELSF